MIAQKLKNNKIAIGNTTTRKDAIQTVQDLKTGEFYALVRAARNWDKSLNDTRDIMFTTYENEHSKVCKEFDKIYERRQSKLIREKEFVELVASSDADKSVVNKQEQVETKAKVSRKERKKPSTENNNNNTATRKLVNYASDCIGTSKLVRIPTRQIIKIARRRNDRDNVNKVNSVCIDNRLRELFFADCKKCQHFQETNVYELMYSKQDRNIYEKWDAIMDEVYKEGLSVHENNQTKRN